MKNEYLITADLKKRMTAVVPQFVQYDSAILNFKIYDNGLPISTQKATSIEVTNLKSDGIAVVGFGKPYKFADGTWGVRYEFLGSEMTEVGKNRVGLSIFFGDEKISLLPFEIHIVQDLRDIAAGNISQEDTGLLTQLIETVKEVTDNANKATADANNAANKANIAADRVDKTIADSENKITEMDSSIKDSKSATDKAKIATDNANTATNKANTAASKADTATENADKATAISKATTENAKEQAKFANEQGDYAKEQGDRVDELVTNSIHRGTWSSANNYKKFQEVIYEGSTYRAKKDHRDIKPPNTSVWQLVASKGMDGKGTVGSVNGKKPTTGGNVDLGELVHSVAGIAPDSAGDVPLTIGDLTLDGYKPPTATPNEYEKGITSFRTTLVQSNEWHREVIGGGDNVVRTTVLTIRPHNRYGATQLAFFYRMGAVSGNSLTVSHVYVRSSYDASNEVAWTQWRALHTDKSDQTDLDSSDTVATSKAVFKLQQEISELRNAIIELGGKL